MSPPLAPRKHGTGAAEAAASVTGSARGTGTGLGLGLGSILDRIGRAVHVARCWQARRSMAAHGLVIRDLLAGEAVMVRARLPDPGPGPSSEDLLRQARQEIGIATAWSGGQAVAVGFIHWQGPRHRELLQQWPDVPEIYRLHVLPAYRSHGVGAQLVQFFEGRARRSGRAHIGLGVHGHNLRALALYRRLGYGPEATPFTDEYLQPASGGERQVVKEPALFLVRELGREPRG